MDVDDITNGGDASTTADDDHDDEPHPTTVEMSSSVSIMDALEVDPSSQVITTESSSSSQPRPLPLIDQILVASSMPEPEPEIEDKFDYDDEAQVTAVDDDVTAVDDDVTAVDDDVTAVDDDVTAVDDDVTAVDDEIPCAQVPRVDDSPAPGESMPDIPERDKDETYVRQVVSQLPISKIRKLMKMDPDTKLIQNESIVLIAFATELFIKTLSTSAARVAVRNKRKTIKREDIDSCIQNIQYFEFLEDMV